MAKKLKTINLSGKQYAQVAERLRAIHEDHKDFDIVTDYELAGETAVLTAEITIRITKEDVVKYTGHSFGKIGAQKAFEKLETIAVGRALAFAGYHADGEIASADEMQDMEASIDKEILADAVMQICNAENVEELEATYKGLAKDLKQSKEIIEAGKKRKKELTEID